MPTVKVAFRGDQTQLSETARKAQASIEKVKQSGGTIGKAMAVGKAGALAVAAGVAFAAAKVASLATNMETLEASFTAMLGSANEAKKVLADIQKLGASTPYEFLDLADAGKKLMAFGVETKDIVGTLTRLGDVASGLNIPLGELAEIYGKAKVQGRAFAEDINQLTGRGIPIIQELAKQFGVADKDVKKLVESGKVGFPEIEKAFVSLTSQGGKFFGMMEAQSKTMSGLLSTLKDELSAIGAAIGMELLPSAKEFLNFVLAGVKELKDFGIMGSDLDSIGKRMAQGGALVAPLDAATKAKQDAPLMGETESQKLDRIWAEMVAKSEANLAALDKASGFGQGGSFLNIQGADRLMKLLPAIMEEIAGRAKAQVDGAVEGLFERKKNGKPSSLPEEPSMRGEQIVSNLAREGGATGLVGGIGGDMLGVQREQRDILKRIERNTAPASAGGMGSAWI